MTRAAAADTSTDSFWSLPPWAFGLFSAIIYIEMCVIVCLKIHLPVPPDPVFKKVDPFEYHWVKGPYDDDWDGCDPDLHYCYTELI